ncbi:MAG TPA: FAD-dependent oxidoreductase [Gaiellaceae bacterium]|nr:FAD-dependent oxidoreductase [Gaiellaceae bacterium]
MNARTIVVVGAGLAGARAAETLRGGGYDGRVVVLGEEPVAPYERPALSKEFLAGTRDEASLLLRKPAFWTDRSIELVLGTRVVALDPVDRVVRTTEGGAVGFDHAIVATGARPRRLPLELPAGAHELRTLADARALRAELAPGARLVVVGGGFVGAEVASTALELGLRVTIVEAANAPLARVLGEDVGLLLAARWQRRGIDVRLRTGIGHVRADAGGRVDSVLLSDGSELRADVLLVGVGVAPAAELLPPRPAVHVHAAGDVSGSGHWTAAAHDGAAAARRILGLPAAAPQAPYVWSDQFGLRLQLVGQPDPDGAIELEGGDDSFAVRYLDAAGETRAALLANRPAEAASLRRRLAGTEVALAA